MPSVVLCKTQMTIALTVMTFCACEDPKSQLGRDVSNFTQLSVARQELQNLFSNQHFPHLFT